ncbi:MAG: peptide chain release factor N(5)-glutamine methyltransferase [Deltaproteobacteria bacterium]|nr:peptide chain release factor N(5)-glutamine methyltransferase [Deltaproteobacteria bacterium]
MSTAAGGDSLWTIGRVLTWSTTYLTESGQTSSPRLDAEVLLAHSLGLTRIQLYTEFDKPLTAHEREPFKANLKRRSQGEPVAYITGVKEFMGYEFSVGPEVLVPRPDTEILVEAALALVKDIEAPAILDVGTGSGCIALSLALKRPDAQISAWDIDEGALGVATSNATKLGATVSFRRCDALQSDVWQVGERFDLLVSNPPYIRPDERASLPNSVLGFEPLHALFAAPDGLSFYRSLAVTAPSVLKKGGHLALEIGYTQAAAVMAILAEAGWSHVTCHKDWERRDRVIQAEWAGE